MTDPSPGPQPVRFFYQGRRIILFGGAGFIGRAVVQRLLAWGAAVTVVDGIMADSGAERGDLESLGTAIAFYPTPIEEVAGLDALVRSADLIIDAMGYTRHLVAFDQPFIDVQANLLSHLTLIQALKSTDGAKVIYLGSRGQYGRNHDSRLVTESTSQIPTDVQGINKTAAESLYRIYSRKYGFEAVSLRVTNCYGEGQLTRGADIGLLGTLIRDLLADRTYEVFGSLKRVLPILFIDDLVDVILAVGSRWRPGFQACNVAGQSIALQELLDNLISIIGSGSFQIVAAPDSHKAFVDEEPVSFRDDQLIRWIGEYQKTDLKEALARTVTYFRTAGGNE